MKTTQQKINPLNLTINDISELIRAINFNLVKSLDENRKSIDVTINKINKATWNLFLGGM